MPERENTIRDPIFRPSGPKGGSLSLLSYEHTQVRSHEDGGNSTDIGCEMTRQIVSRAIALMMSKSV